MKNNEEIVIGKGLASLAFGANGEDVRKLFGEPDELEKELDEDDIADELWHYDEKEISFGFDEDGRVINISVTSSETLLQGVKLIGMSQKELDAALKQFKFEDLDQEICASDSEEVHTVISSENAGINFWLEDGVLIEIQWEVPYSEDGEPQWAN